MKLFDLVLIVSLCDLGLQGAGISPTPCPNPWADDYESFSLPTDSAHWGTYNVHDPACRKVGDFYYMYSTDAFYFGKKHKEGGERPEALGKRPKMGFLQMRRSPDLVNWEFMGWAFDSIPQEPVDWVKSNVAPEKRRFSATNIWAPYMVPAPDDNGYRIYYCVSAFGEKVSMISLATAPTPLGPWTNQGCVVKTNDDTPMNAIDPTISDVIDGRQWMIYGSYFGGIYCVELDPATGNVKTPGDLGHLVARRANYQTDNLEAPELIYSPEHKKYYLFGSYDPLMTTYNVRVGRSDTPEGPFYDFNGLCLADTTNNLPILTAPYQFEGHPGWAGVAHCGVFNDGQGNWYMCHQGRLAPDYQMIDLHLRRMFFTPDGWPVVSPERYAGTPKKRFEAEDLEGEWEIVRIHEPEVQRELMAGQVSGPAGPLLDGELCKSERLTLEKGGNLGQNKGKWSFDTKNQLLCLNFDTLNINNIITFAGQDWERSQETVLFTGLDPQGRTIWGKKIQ